MICKNCGRELKDGTRFCAYCGAAQAQTPAVWQMQQPAGDSAALQPSPAPAARPRKKSKLPLVLGAAAVVLLVLIFAWPDKSSFKNLGNGELAALEQSARFGDDSEKLMNYQDLRDRCKAQLDSGNEALDIYLYYGESLAWLEESEEDLREALRAYKNAEKISSDSHDAIIGMVDVYIRLQEYDNAKEVLLTSDALDEDTRQEWLSRFEPGENKTKIIRDYNYNERKVCFYDENGDCTDYVVIEYCEGRKTSAAYYTADGSQAGYVAYEYDDNGNEVKGYGSEAVHFLIVESEYDENGRVADEKMYYRNGDFYAEERHTYYEDGTTKTYWCKYAMVPGYGLLEYDEQGQLTKITNYNDDGSVEYYTVREYNENGEKIAETTYNADGSIR